MLTYTRGDRIPPELRDDRFIYQGRPSAIALKKYWRLLPDGRPDPECQPYRAQWEIEREHRAFPQLGSYRIEVTPPGRPRSREGTRQKYQQQYYQKRKNHE